MNIRILIAAAMLFLVTLFVRVTAEQAHSVPAPLFPRVLGAWHGADAAPLDPETQRLLGADWYVNRVYTDNAQLPVGVYVAYYGAQRPGVGLHSPLHCLPGTGWETLQTRTIDVSAAAGVAPERLRELVVRKDDANALVVYWYDVHGRVVAGEAASKLWLLRGAFTERRSDAALVRVVVPITGSVEAAEAVAVSFARTLFPVIGSIWS